MATVTIEKTVKITSKVELSDSDLDFSKLIREIDDPNHISNLIQTGYLVNRDEEQQEVSIKVISLDGRKSFIIK